ncbi:MULTISPECIES: hypothetical protein [unclassified Paenibacillus]|uniref:hypothetical protein n=1 Tax=unclassified Paenibacillus TaxID=185978 RepID=UPI002406845E|nr:MULTISPECIES: hypothetical protein [unclassified Paenibacillus]MDF9842492.1 hypothetical protein [Paenibacillus sp. PastF-2]MDF9849082.1 hypothetical protein [Paenibacillus sp. PastM-2]MDF9855652.1 hypothetical protein [Paenibacillus sp. PastF-1]MDH6480924.1 hypothetical protein [Paenibacillus sp. PastH-2]MDH6508346.1 hypothetical protein [Paenibacillus sp. PastM-3]
MTTRKILPGMQNTSGQNIKVTVGAAEMQDARVIDPSGAFTTPGDNTREAKSAMSEYIKRCKDSDVQINYL